MKSIFQNLSTTASNSITTKGTASCSSSS